MFLTFLRRLWANVGTVLLAFALAFAVWISAVVAADPNEQREYPNPLPLEVRGQNPSLILLGNLPEQVSVRLSAPVSLWEQLTGETDALTAFIDLVGLEAGEHTLPVQIDSDLIPLRIVQVLPEEVIIELQPRAVREFTITPQIEGEPALGFQAGELVIEPELATVTGPQNLLLQVAEVIAPLNVSEATEPIVREVELQAVDVDGNVLSGLTIEPSVVAVDLSIRQAGGYRTVAVRVETIGQPASGYRVTNISVEPTVVVLFSTDQQLIDSLPGFVSTLGVDLTNIQTDLETRLSLALPEGVILVGDEQSVEVVIGVAPIESSVLVTFQVEVVGLASGFEAQLSPQTVSVVISGPLSVLQGLGPNDVRLFVRVTGLTAGIHLLEPQAEILREDLQVLSITPSTIEVVISRTQTP
jgi:YbbR domain-containing protein